MEREPTGGGTGLKALRVMGFIGGALLALVGFVPLIWAAAEGVNVVKLAALIYITVGLIGVGLIVAAAKTRRGRPCPQCGKSVRLGLVVCPTCAYDFTVRT